MNKDSIAGTFLVAICLCLAASLLVSSAAVGLKPTQELNKALDKKKNILIAAGLYKDASTIDSVFEERITPKLIDLATGDYVDGQDPAAYDTRKMAKDPEQGYSIPAELDWGKIKTRAKYAVIYEVSGESGDKVQTVLPVHGKGLWSTLYGFVSVDKDSNTIKGLGFYEHAETPGLGGEIDNPSWKALWPGKKIYNDGGEIKIDVIKGLVDAKNPEAEHLIDGISGATITARGVGNLIRYWMSDEGYKKYLEKQKAN
jgi:Na+-transporting NADH:ubiquinone oxidoreductase subunit C